MGFGMSAREWCEGGLYINGDNFMMTSARTAFSGLQDLKILRLETRIQYTLLGEGRLTGTLEKPVVGRDAWRSAMTSCGKLHPDSKRRKNTSCPEAYLCNRKSLWALAWLTLVVTLAGTVLADVELR